MCRHTAMRVVFSFGANCAERTWHHSYDFMLEQHIISSRKSTANLDTISPFVKTLKININIVWIKITKSMLPNFEQINTIFRNFYHLERRDLRNVNIILIRIVKFVFFLIYALRQPPLVIKYHKNSKEGDLNYIYAPTACAACWLLFCIISNK